MSTGLMLPSIDLTEGSPKGPRAGFKARLCVFKAAGNCIHGERCSYAHDPSELADGKTHLCPLYQENACLLGGLCRFAHGPAELRVPPRAVKPAACRYWSKGRCLAGNSCRHAHGDDEIRTMVRKVNPPPRMSFDAFGDFDISPPGLDNVLGLMPGSAASTPLNAGLLPTPGALSFVSLDVSTPVVSLDAELSLEDELAKAVASLLSD